VSPSRYVGMTTRSQSLIRFELTIITHNHQGRYGNVVLVGGRDVYWYYVLLCYYFIDYNEEFSDWIILIN